MLNWVWRRLRSAWKRSYWACCQAVEDSSQKKIRQPKGRVWGAEQSSFSWKGQPSEAGEGEVVVRMGRERAGEAESACGRCRTGVSDLPGGRRGLSGATEVRARSWAKRASSIVVT